MYEDETYRNKLNRHFRLFETQVTMNVREKTFTHSVKRQKKPTRCNNHMFIINFCLNLFRASLCPSSGEQRPCYCIRCTALVLLDVVGSGCGALRCRMRAVDRSW